jgi:hypothetical protein
MASVALEEAGGAFARPLGLRTDGRLADWASLLSKKARGNHCRPGHRPDDPRRTCNQ